MPNKRPAGVVFLVVCHLLGAVLGVVVFVLQITGGFAALSALWVEATSAPTRRAWEQPPPGGGPARGPTGLEAARANAKVAEAARTAPGYSVYEAALPWRNLVAALLLLFAAQGVSRMRGWGRGLSLAYALLGLAWGVGSLVYMLAIVFPAQDASLRAGILREAPAALEAFQRARLPFLWGSFVGVVFYPLIVLGVLAFPGVRRGFRKGKPADVAEAEPAPEESGAAAREEATDWREENEGQSGRGRDPDRIRRDRDFARGAATTGRRPAAVTVIAVLHFIVAALSLCGVAGTIFSKEINELAFSGSGQAARDQRRLQEGMEAAPGYRAAQVSLAVLGLLNVVLLLGAGVGLLAMRPWARAASLFYAILVILTMLTWLTYFFVGVMPVLDPVIGEVYRNNPAAALGGKVGAVGGSVGSSCFIMIYPIAVLIVMCLPSVDKAFRAAPRRGDEDDAFDDYEDEEDYPRHGRRR